MSVNITVNSKLPKYCEAHSLLLDPVKAKKEEEEARRKVRLLQVRQQSKKIAEKIRNDVKESMRKENQKYEATLANEFNCWRHHAQQDKMRDYRAAVFQIGTAHAAAKNEIRMQCEQKDAKRKETYKQFRKQMAARQKNKDRQYRGPCICNKVQVCADDQFECACDRMEDSKLQESHKRKRDSCFSSCDSSSSTDDEEGNDGTLNDSSISSCVMPSATTAISCQNKGTQTSLMCPSANLKKTPAVFLDVEAGSDDSVLITAPAEIKDRHAEYNQQYTSVVRESPRMVRKIQDKIKQAEPTPSLMSSEQSTELMKKTTKSLNIPDKKNSQPIAQERREKRFTLISNIVRKQGNMERHENTSPSRKQQSADSNSRVSPTRSPVTMPRCSQNVNAKVTSPRKTGASSKSSPNIVSKLSSSPKAGGSFKSSENFNFKATSPRKVSASSKTTQNSISKITSPRKASASSKSSQNFTSKLSSARNVGEPSKTSSNYVVNVTSPRKASASSKSTRFIAEKEKRSSVSISAASGNTLALGSSCGTSGRVQFYDYNSKLSKDGLQDKTNVTVNRQDETDQITAMEQAAIENRLRHDRQQDMLNRNQQMEELGQKALEREQARRDCNDLTEKLEALTRQYPRQLPASENAPHIFVDKQLRKEGKMNTAIENMLNRPNIITCSEVNPKQFERSSETKPLNENVYPSEINVGMASDIPAKDVSSDSCCSILLGYVDDQSRQVRKDLEMWPMQTESNDKQIRLKNLLKRLDKMRKTLLQELKSVQSDEMEKNARATRDEQFADLIDTITKCRQEREEIMIDSIVQSKGQNNMEKNRLKSRDKNNRPLDRRENELRLKEDLLEKKVRAFYEQMQKEKNRESIAKAKNENTDDYKENAENISDDYENKENIDCSSLETPVQIVITVKGESKCISIPGKAKKKTPAKKKSTQLATLIKSPQPCKKLTPKKKAPVGKQFSGTVLGRQNSYDSNSTSYTSLPPQISNELGNMVNNLQLERPHSRIEGTQTSLEFDNETCSNQSKEPVAPLNPLVVQYIQRLLGMSRKAVQRLGVSSSDIETPSSSIVNTTDNLASQDSVILDERMAFVESFMQENYSFIKELEQSLRSNNQSAMENSIRIMDDIWRKRLKQKSQTDNKSKQNTNTKLRKNLNTCSKAQKYYKERNAKENQHSDETVNKADRVPKKTNENVTHQQNLADKTPFSRKKQPLQGNANDVARTSKVVTKEISTVCAKNEKVISTSYPANSNTTDSDTQIARYAQLTENCTHRIAELTELISRVRQEKQRLLEVTLSSVSDNGRTSTEYAELQNGKSHVTNEPAETSVASSSDLVQNSKKQPPLEMYHQAPKLSALEKNRHITASQDSGIAESRPITAQENRNDIEPISHTSTDSQVINATAHQRKQKPPAVLRRFSPQFQEEELVHELSTILEVDTPANSRINTAIGQMPADDRLTASEPLRQPVMFPTFQEYVKQRHLDITLLDAEESAQLHNEFSLYIEDLQKSQIQENPQYKEFPPINAFLSSSNCDNEHHETIDEESVGQMRLKSIRFEQFPDVRRYVQRQQQRYTSVATSSPTDEPKMLDTESLENLTDIRTNSNTDNENDTASIDIEQELKRRNILKKSFRCTQSSGQVFSSTAHQDAAFYDDVIAAESGVEKFSTSENTVPFLEADLKRLVRQWPTYAQGEEKHQHEALSTTTASTKPSNTKKRDMKSTSLDESSNALGRPLNLHDFLKRELLKHVHLTDSTTTTSSSDVSLHSQFLYSLIGTLTPITTSKSGQQTLDRQKTSTPVPAQISQPRSTPSNPSRPTSSQLFSGESRLSSVHMNDGSHRFHNTSEGVNADQSSN